MKKPLTIVILFIFAVSCSLPSHSFQNPSQTGVDFSRGKWLLYTVDAPIEARKKLEKKIVEDFSGPIGKRLAYYPTSKGLLVAQRMDLPLDRKTIAEIKEGTGYDFFINVKAGKISEGLGSVSFSQNRLPPAEQSNSSYAEIEIYDLNSGTIVYSQKAVSSVRRSNDDDKVHLAKSSSELIYHAYRKLFRDLESKSAK